MAASGHPRVLMTLVARSVPQPARGEAGGLKVASLFSGCGGLDLGLKQAGHEVRRRLHSTGQHAALFALSRRAAACRTAAPRV